MPQNPREVREYLADRNYVNCPWYKRRFPEDRENEEYKIFRTMLTQANIPVDVLHDEWNEHIEDYLTEIFVLASEQHRRQKLREKEES